MLDYDNRHQEGHEITENDGPACSVCMDDKCPGGCEDERAYLAYLSTSAEFDADDALGASPPVETHYMMLRRLYAVG
jgi:hypothetical protein